MKDKKVIYYYYDEAGNRRPMGSDDIESFSFKTMNEYLEKHVKYHPYTKNNFYAQIDGKEFKLL